MRCCRHGNGLRSAAVLYPNRGYGATWWSLVNYLAGKHFITVYGNRSDGLLPTEQDVPSAMIGGVDGSYPPWEGTVSLQVKGLVKQSL